MAQSQKNDLSVKINGLIAPGTRHERIIEQKNSLPIRLDRFLVESFPLYSRSYFKRLIHEGCATVNGKQANKQSTLLNTGDTLMLLFPKEHAIEPTIIAEQTEDIRIVAVNEHFIVINKPAGIAVHKPHSSYVKPTVVDWLLLKHQEVSHIGYIDRPGIVHRLDKDTSGLMIIVRTNHAHEQFTTLFKDRTIHKTYRALVEGHPPAQGSIDFQIGRHPVHRNKMAVFNCAAPQSFSQKDGHVVRDAITEYKVVRYYETCSLVEVKPTTGRTHQIRVHFAALGHPLLGDLLYGNKSIYMQRHALHAQEISFYFDEKLYHFTIEPAADFTNAVEALQMATAE